MGIVGLETAFPILYTHFVKKGILSLEKLSELMHEKPLARFDLPRGKDMCIFELSEEYSIDPGKFFSMGRATPFAGDKVYGRCVLTVMDGKTVYKA